MILSVDLNPVLNKWVEISSNSKDLESFKACNELMIPGDGGAYLSLILSMMNEESSITGFLGGPTGSFIRKYLCDSGVDVTVVEIGDKSTERLILIFNDREIEINLKGAEISREEITLFHREFKEGLNNCELVCMCGEYPENMPVEMPVDMVQLAREWGRKILIAPRKDFLQGVSDASPFMIVLDVEGLESLTNLKLEYEGEIIRASQYLFQNDIAYVVIDMGKDGLLVMNSEVGFSMSIEDNVRDTYGFMRGGILAGFAAGIKRSYDFETTARLSFACGTLDFRRHDGIPDMTDIKALMNKIDIRKFHNQ